MAGGARVSATTLVRLLDAAGGRRPCESIYKWLADGIRSALLDGRLTVGSGLPSERELAMSLGVSRTTVVGAYRLLRDQGWLNSRQGSGAWLRLPGEVNNDLSRASRDAASLTAAAFGASAIFGWDQSARSSDNIRSPDGMPETIDLTAACPPAPTIALADALNNTGRKIVQYCGEDGYLPFGVPILREVIADRYCRTGVETAVEQILITSGAQHALTLLIAQLSAPGESVLTESPTYPIVLDALRAHRRIPVSLALTEIPVPGRAVRGYNWDLELMSSIFRQTRPRLAYMIPDFHNPTGSLMDSKSREVVVTLARRAGTHLLIDEAFRELPFPGSKPMPPPMALYDRDVVISIGSMSKSFWGGLRVGWIRAPRKLIEQLAAARVLVDMAGSVLDQLVAVELLSQSDRLLPERQIQLAQGAKCLEAAIAQYLPTWLPTSPAGGASMWARIPQHARATDLALLAPSHGVRIAPGPRFAPDGTMNTFVRLPFTLPPAILWEGIERLKNASSQDV